MVHIRPVEKSDHPYLLRLLDLNTPRYFSADEKDDFIRYLNFEIEYYFVIQNDGEIVGCGGFNLWDEGKTARISWDVFHPSQQGFGFGSELLEFRINKIKEIGNVEKIVVRTSQMAFGFYQKYGFQLTEKQKDYWGKGYDLYHMEQNL